jgi:uncharacterized Zn finger protein
LCEREAEQSGSYERLVERLLAAGRSAEAEQWARKGIVTTERQYPGIASQLREVIGTLRAQAGDWVMVAALRRGILREADIADAPGARSGGRAGPGSASGARGGAALLGDG